MKSDLDEALDTARHVVGEAAALVVGNAGNVGTVETKSTFRDLVTEWDLRSETLIRKQLAKYTSTIPVLGEETDTGSNADCEYRWVCDPIDGTVNFAHGIPAYSVVLSLEHWRKPIVGVVVAPALGWEFYAKKGGGAFMNGEPIVVSTTPALSQAVLSSGFPYDLATSEDNNFAEWEHFQRTAGACRRFGCASLDLSMLARGWFDGYWETKLKAWDLSAGALLVQEAGGCVTAIDGGVFMSDAGEALASNGKIHKQMVAELGQVKSRCK